MAVAVVMPKLGNSVESTVLVNWRKRVGDRIALGEVLCEVETDKAMMEVESTASGTVLALLYEAGDEIPVMVDIAIVGEPGETVNLSVQPESPGPASKPQSTSPTLSSVATVTANGRSIPANNQRGRAISPRARKLAAGAQLDLAGVQGTGPRGRIIERDVKALLNAQTRAEPHLTPVARQMVASGNYALSDSVDLTKRITKNDLVPASPIPTSADAEIIPLKGTRKVIATRLLESVQTTAQLTLNTSADARALQAYRKWLKNSPPKLGLNGITINDLVLYAVAQTLPIFPDLNALFQEQAVHRYRAVHLGMAVDTDRGLIVPVIRDAASLGLQSLAQTAHQLAEACQSGQISPADLAGGTFTVTNLGGLGIESFTPVLNPPQVAILGVGNIQLKPLMIDEVVQFIPHIGLSLTINHQVVDGAPAAHFLQALTANLAKIDQI
jgi:pyruvate dehydrogenase E2 component (dihydrolipoamide acetyltransferase)